MLLGQLKTNCKMCDKSFKFFSGFENISIVDKSIIIPLCKKCSKKVLEFIEDKSKK